ncbi:MAG: hypothetical protein ISP49_03980 [Reyranella sp.]|jgi:hypothetical protein|nr:hypothetical protein [Reyranella sp.]MBL6650727.1 hypothetical protein [Reyranella sp.]
MDTAATCQCGKVRFKAIGRPIVAASCYCTNCQEAGRQLERLASAPPVLDPDGGTSMILYRKDRVRCLSGRQHLQEHRLKSDSPTRRVVAACCNSAMFLDFTKGHWLSLYRNRFATGALPDDVPTHRVQSAPFMLKLIAAWMAMGFRRPRSPDLAG